VLDRVIISSILPGPGALEQASKQALGQILDICVCGGLGLHITIRIVRDQVVAEGCVVSSIGNGLLLTAKGVKKLEVTRIW
jgi:hypothetical protein